MPLRFQDVFLTDKEIGTEAHRLTAAKTFSLLEAAINNSDMNSDNDDDENSINTNEYFYYY